MTFERALGERNPDPGGRRWILVPEDQLSDRIGPLSREDPRELGILLVESRASLRRLPYHRQRIALVLANLRHFALEQAERGVAVRYLRTPGSHADAVRSFRGGNPVPAGVAPIRVMRPAERELRKVLEPLVRDGTLEEIPHEGWLTDPRGLERSQSGPPWRMDAFYRQVRRESGILMEEGRPVGGRFSFDTENRLPWRGSPPPAVEPEFALDGIREEVVLEVERDFTDHPGALRPSSLPATRGDAETLWAWALRECLPHFGPFEDAMSVRSTTLFHTRISALLNLHRLLPREVVAEVAAADLPLASKEGFIRQILGWREFVRHIHEATDGFHELPAGLRVREGAPLPAFFWGTGRSGLRCLDHVVASVWEEGYSHHITRLMVLCNLATLLEISPRELSDWFRAAYTDAWDWVVEPNVLGMGTHALGELMTTKPYISGAAYIERMSDFCGSCAFDPRRTCPVTSLYWAWLDRHEGELRENPRMKLPLASMRKRSDLQRQQDRVTFERARDQVASGRPLSPPAGHEEIPGLLPG